MFGGAIILLAAAGIGQSNKNDFERQCKNEWYTTAVKEARKLIDGNGKNGYELHEVSNLLKMLKSNQGILPDDTYNIAFHIDQETTSIQRDGPNLDIMIGSTDLGKLVGSHYMPPKGDICKYMSPNKALVSQSPNVY